MDAIRFAKPFDGNEVPFRAIPSYWYARSSEFMQPDLIQTLRWMRVSGDTVFFLGAVALVLLVAGLKTGHSFKSEKQS